MNFCYLKEDKQCKGCEGLIFAGEKAVIIRLKVSTGVKLPFAFHPQCFMGWSNAMFVYRLEKWGADNPPKEQKSRRGRPRKYTNFLKASRLEGRICYYRKRGNQDKVQELEHMLSDLEIRRE